MELRPGEEGEAKGQFMLELWRFFEMWREPAKAKTPPGQEAPKDPKEGLHRAETRVALAGHFEIQNVPAVRLSGFERQGLNQAFGIAPGMEINGLPVWWSEDGHFFLYFAVEYGHWKANGLKMAGGDGPLLVKNGQRRSGFGFAHSGKAQETPSSIDGRPAVSPEAAVQALLNPEGWFEAIDGEWVAVKPGAKRCEAERFRFRVQKAKAEELFYEGQETSSKRMSGSGATFSAIRFRDSTERKAVLFLPTGRRFGSIQELISSELPLAEPTRLALSLEDGDDEDAGFTHPGDPDVVCLATKSSPPAKL